MLAKESVQAFSDKDWIYEIKWDGYRAIAEVNQDDVLMYSRNGNTFNNSYPVVAEALAALNIHAILDGEIVALNEEGTPSFQFLQHYDTDPDHPLRYYVFDVLEINGTDTKDLPLIERKKLLKELLQKNEVIVYSDHIHEEGEAFFEIAKERGLEGILAKKADSLYMTGTRSAAWVKIKHHQTQDAIIAGFTAPGGSRNYFGALILGVWKGKELHYIGHTGSGFNQQGLKEMSKLLKPLIQNKSPFSKPVKTNAPVTWVKPVLVGEVKYAEMTRDGSMRQPIFLRLRTDKQAKEVTMESQKKIVKKSEPEKKVVKKANKKQSEKAAPVRTKKTSTVKTGETLSFGKIDVPITNTSKIFWPKEGFTKGDVIQYYQEVSNYILPYLKGRPQSLMRTPNGIDKPGFYHKDAADEAPEWVTGTKIFSESTNKDIDYIICDNRATLAYLNNLGCIEINPWHSTVKALDKPDYLVIDLDPSSKNSFDQVVETANAVKEVLDRAGAASFCKTSGATGLHVYIPTQKKYTYDQVKDFAQLICLLTNELVPDFTTMERNLKKRGNQKIYLDHLQNRRGQTIACAYSLRPKAGATVSAPLLWKEVKKGLTPQEFTIKTIFKRLQKTGDLFEGVLGKGINLSSCLKKLGA